VRAASLRCPEVRDAGHRRALGACEYWSAYRWTPPSCLTVTAAVESAAGPALYALRFIMFSEGARNRARPRVQVPDAFLTLLPRIAPPPFSPPTVVLDQLAPSSCCLLLGRLVLPRARGALERRAFFALREREADQRRGPRRARSVSFHTCFPMIERFDLVTARRLISASWRTKISS